jgi:hypothetical protein
MSWSNYAKQRAGLQYYGVVRQYLEKTSPGQSILDVGCGGTPTVYAGDYEFRTAVNLEPLPHYPGVETVIGDFATVTLPRKLFSAVACCQVLEHLTDAQLPRFVRRLFAVAERSLVVSVPYKWRAGACSDHHQDPIDRPKLRKMLGRQWTEHQIVRDDGVDRIVVWYDLK